MNRRAFTLLEVVVALAILAMSLMAILDVNGQAVYSHVYARKLTVATLLARSKMTDLEQKLYDEGLNADDEEDAGDFSDEGWPSFKWRSKVIVPQTNGLPPEQLFAAVFNLGSMAGGDGSAGLLSALFGGGGGDLASMAKGAGLPTDATGGAAGGLGGLLAGLGPMAGMLQTLLTQMTDQLTNSVREVHLTVSWKEGSLTESIDLVTHVVSLGPGGDRNGGAAAAAGQSSASTWVRPDGTPARNPRPAPSGSGMVDDDGTPLMTSSQQNLSSPLQLGSPFGGARPLVPQGVGSILRGGSK